MQKLSSLLLTTFIGISMVALANESMAQTSPAPLKTGTRRESEMEPTSSRTCDHDSIRQRSEPCLASPIYSTKLQIASAP
jgi:hypothetical protein